MIEFHRCHVHLVTVILLSLLATVASRNQPYHGAPADPSSVNATSNQQSTTLSPDGLQRQQIKCIIENELSSEQCEDTVASQATDDSDLVEGCATIERFQPVLSLVGCSSDDYTKMHDATCTWDGSTSCVNYYRQQVELIEGIEGRLTQSCNKTIIHDVKVVKVVNTNVHLDTAEYCNKLGQVKDGLIEQKVCNSAEISDLEKAVCCDKQECFENIDTSTREGQVTVVLRRLKNKVCGRTLTAGIKQLSQSLDASCKALEATKPALLTGLVCTDDDYRIVEKVICGINNDPCAPGNNNPGCTTTVDPFPKEKEQRDKIQDVISNQLEEKCQTFMIQQAATSAADPLAKTCSTFLDNWGFIVVGDQCSQKDYETLKAVICSGNTAWVKTVSGLLILVSVLVQIVAFVS